MSSGVVRRCFLAAVLAVFLLSVTSSCGGSRGVTVGQASAHSYSKGKKAGVKSTSGSGKTGNLTSPLPLSSSLSPSTRKLLQQAYGWLGTPYAYGGTDHSGVDCSGLVMSVYRDALDIKLPRSSSKQKEYCQPLELSSISEGDLLFFTPSGRDIGHVGLYVGEGYMIHASNTGVVLTPLDSPWVKKRFHSAGRVATYWSAVAAETDKLRKASERKPSPAIASAGKKKKKSSTTVNASPAQKLRVIATVESDSISSLSFFE